MTAGRGNRILWTECSELQEVNLLDVKENDSEKSSLINVKVEEDSRSVQRVGKKYYSIPKVKI